MFLSQFPIRLGSPSRLSSRSRLSAAPPVARARRRTLGRRSARCHPSRTPIYYAPTSQRGERRDRHRVRVYGSGLYGPLGYGLGYSPFGYSGLPYGGVGYGALGYGYGYPSTR